MMRRSLCIVVAVLAAALAVTGCAHSGSIDLTQVTVDVTGTWYGTMVGAAGGGFGSFSSGAFRLELEQKGSHVTGSIRAVGDTLWLPTAEPIEGSVVGDVFTFKDMAGSLASLMGELTVSGDKMEGSLSAQVIFRGSLRRVDPSAGPSSPKP